jgi:hypothetical protein
VEAGNLALLLDGTDFESYASGPDHPGFHTGLGLPFTVECWFKPADDAGERMILNKEDSWEFANKEGLFQAAVAPAGAAWGWHDSKLKTKVNEWNHGALSWDGKNVRMFLNGREGQQSELAGDAMNATGDTFKVGRRERGGATHSIFNGLIDEVRLSKGLRYKGDYDVPRFNFRDDKDTLAIYHFDEIVNVDQIENYAQLAANPCPDLTLEGAVELVEPGAPLSVEPHDKLTTVWGRLKAAR